MQSPKDNWSLKQKKCFILNSTICFFFFNFAIFVTFPLIPEDELKA